MKVKVSKNSLPALLDVPLHYSYKEEHNIKLQLFNEKIACESPYLSDDEVRYYAVTLSIEKGTFLDIMGIALDDGNYLFTAVMHYSDAGKPTITYYASLEDGPNEQASSLPAKLTTIHNHPNFVKGSAVVFAGFIKIADSLLTHIDNNSGHYKLTFDQAKNFIAKLILDLELEELTFDDYSPLLKEDTAAIYTVESTADFSEVIFISNVMMENHNNGKSVKKMESYKQIQTSQGLSARYNSRSTFFSTIEQITGQVIAQCEQDQNDSQLRL